MVVKPAVSPETIPVLEPMVATMVLLLLHTPREDVSAKVIVPPVHTFVMPVIGAGFGFTTTDTVVRQPVASNL